MPMNKFNSSPRANAEDEAVSSTAKTTKVPPATLARVVEWIRHHLYRLHQELTPAPAAMMEMIIATWTSQAITVAAQLGVADALSHGPLRSDAPISMTWAAQFYGSAEQRERWTLMVDSIRTGSTVVPALRGKESFDYFAGEPELAELFNQTMTSVSELTDGPVVAGYDFGAYPTIVDVGGGHGPLLAAILAGAPESRGVLYDLPRVVANAPTLLCERNVADRVRIVEGSFFDSVPAGGDAYILKNILHDWPDEKAETMPRKVRA